MRIQALIEGLLSSSDTIQNVTDPFWNSVMLLMPLDYRDSAGLPWYKDYSKQMHRTSMFAGTRNTTPETSLALIDASSPAFVAGDGITSYTLINNSVNHAHAISQLNAKGSTGGMLDPIEANRIETQYSLSAQPELGEGDFTIEVSFYVDQINLPWRRQVIVSQGCALSSTFYVSAFSNSSSINPSTIGNLLTNNNQSHLPVGFAGWALYIDDSTLRFNSFTTNIVTIATGIVPLTWYHIAVQRKAGILTTYVNGQKTAPGITYNIAHTGTYEAPQFRRRRITVGASHAIAAWNGGATYAALSVYNGYGSMSGGICNFRLTSAARYTQDVYSVSLPFPDYPALSPPDLYSADRIYSLPSTYDYFDYGAHKAHITNTALTLKSAPRVDTGHLELNGTDTYTTSQIATTLGDTWTLEWEDTFFLNHVPIHIQDPNNSTGSTGRYGGYYDRRQFLFADNIIPFHSARNTRFPIIELTTSTGKKILKISHVLVEAYTSSGAQEGLYTACNISTDGTTWVTLPGNTNRTLHPYETSLFPNEDQIIAGSFSVNYAGTINALIPLNSALDTVGYHTAIQRTGNELSVYINGTRSYVIPFNYTLYSEANDLVIKFGGYHDPFQVRVLTLTWNSSTTSDTPEITFGIRGFKLTNAAVYSPSAPDNQVDLRNSYPFKSSLGFVPARGRIVEIVRRGSQLSSNDDVEWDVFVNRFIDGFVPEDFSLSQTDTLDGCVITSITKINEYLYRVSATTGTGSGTLSINFLDRNTIRFTRDNALISSFVGELSLTGDDYIIKKEAPQPILYSGSSPYVRDSFYVFVKFDAAIAVFSIADIGITNARITRSDVVDEVEALYRITVVPTMEGVITIQALAGAGVTANGLKSTPSEVFTRVYQSWFTILQLPLDISTNRNDFSPSRLVLNELVAGNTQFSPEAPAGMTSSLSCIPANETSGYTYPFNAVSGLSYLENNADWTIEWFARAVPSYGTSHILSVTSGNLGFCVYMQNRVLYFARNYEQKSALISSFTITEPTAPAWSSTTATTADKYPHYAITKQGDVYRFYRNGVRMLLRSVSTSIDIRQGTLSVGYYKNYVGDVPILISNVRLTYGRALYTSSTVNIPSLPYPVPTNILDYASLVSSIVLFSDNNVPTIARPGNKVFIRFYSLIALAGSDIDLTINGYPATVSQGDNNSWTGEMLVTEEMASEFLSFVLNVDNSSLPPKTFTQSTNGSNVFIDTAALTVEITADDTLNTEIPATITFNKPVDSLVASDITVTNGQVANIQAQAGNLSYRVNVRVITSGVVSITVEAGAVEDRGGALNLASTTFNRTVTLPTYSPDPYWNNVLFLIEPGATIHDSKNNLSVSGSASISTDTAPPGLLSSIYFDGIDDYITVTTSTVIPRSTPFTLDMWMYISSSDVLTLSAPRVFNPTSITTSSFIANWQAVSNADGYVFDAAQDSAFTNLLPGYQAVPVGNVTSLSVAGDGAAEVPTISAPPFISSNSFVGKWSYSSNTANPTLGYQVQVSLNPAFTALLYQYSDTATRAQSSLIGDPLTTLSKYTPPPPVIPPTTPVNQPAPRQGVVVGGLFDADSMPALCYFKSESSIRYYSTDSYHVPAIAEDIDVQEWKHVAIVSDGKFTRLYIDGEFTDKAKNAIDLSDPMTFGYKLGYFNGYMAGIRMTEGIARYSGTEYIIPQLPYAQQ